MAGKARRAAARQGELSRRKKRGQRGPSGIPTTAAPQQEAAQNVTGTAVAESATAPSDVDGETQQPQSAVATVAAPAVRPSYQSPQPRGQGRTRGERPTAYNYVGSELRRIAALSTVVLAALVALSFVI